MLNHAGARAAVQLAQQLATKYQLSSDTTPDEAVSVFMAEVETVIASGVTTADNYLGEVLGPIKIELTATGVDLPSNRRRVFFEKLLSAISERLSAS